MPSAVTLPCASIVTDGVVDAEPTGPVVPGPVFLSDTTPVDPTVASPDNVVGVHAVPFQIKVWADVGVADETVFP